MSQTCSKCGTASLDASRFCRACGTTLGATMTEQRTVVLAPEMPVAQARPSRGHTVLQWAKNAIGTGRSVVEPMVTGPERNGQRELTKFLLDVSGSMDSSFNARQTKLQAAQEAATTMVVNKARLDDQDEIGLVSFDHHARVVLPLCPIASHKRQIIEAIQSLHIQGGTDINVGLEVARDAFEWDRKGVVRRIILLTDGKGGDPMETADDLKKRGVVMDIVGVGRTPRAVDEVLLRQIASVIEGEVRYRFISDRGKLLTHYTDLANKTHVRP